jgi:branched-chain amino acid transport system ATP-binding protein
VEPLLQCRAIHARYGAFHALKGVALDVMPGERIGLFGHNGCGKSTLLKCCVGFRHFVSGAVTFAGSQVVAGAIARNVQLGIGWVPQTRNVFKELTLHQNLKIAGLKHGERDFHQTWSLFPFLEPRRGQVAGTMSGGEQQLLAFAMSLLTKPRLLLLDEPTTGLSPAMAELILQTVEKASRSLGIAVIIVEHNVPRTLKILDRALFMKTGRLVSAMSAEQARKQEDFWEWY